MIDLKSILGYAAGSPFASNPYLDINTPEGTIDMANTHRDLLGIDNLGNIKKMKAGRKKQYRFPGNQVREIPLQTGGMIPNVGYPGMLLDETETAQYALDHAKKLRFHNNGSFKALIPMDAWNDDMMNYVDKFKIIKRRGEQFVKARGKIPRPSAPIPPVQQELPPMQAGGTHSPIYTNNPNDPRLQAYNDSLALYNYYSNQRSLEGYKRPATKDETDYANKQDYAKKDTSTKGTDRLLHRVGDSALNNNINWLQDHSSPDLKSKTIQPIGAYHAKNGPINYEFKEPVQPVIYQKQQPNGTNTPNNQGQRLVREQQQNKPTYGPQQAASDSALLYNSTKKYIPALKKMSSEYQGKELDNKWYDYVQETWKDNPNVKNPVDLAYKRLTDYNNKKPQPIQEFKIGESYANLYQKPVGTPQPQRKGRISNLDSTPQYNMAAGAMPTPHNMDIPQANYDTSKPTKYSFTYPTGQGQNGQKTIYFPGKYMLNRYLEGVKSPSSQEGEDYKTATGHLQKGGYAKKLFNYIFDEGDQAPVVAQPQGAATEKLDETPPSFYDKSEQEQSDFESAMSILADGEEFSNPYNKGFRSFSTYQEGRQALEHQLDLYKTGKSAHTTGNETLAQATRIYAPPSENNTNNYTNFVSKKLGVDPNTPIKNINTKKWADAIQQMEGNKSGNNPGNLRYLFGGYIN